MGHYSNNRLSQNEIPTRESCYTFILCVLTIQTQWNLIVNKAVKWVDKQLGQPWQDIEAEAAKLISSA